MIGKTFSGTGDTKAVKFAILILNKLHERERGKRFNRSDGDVNDLSTTINLFAKESKTNSFELLALSQNCNAHIYYSLFNMNVF